MTDNTEPKNKEYVCTICTFKCRSKSKYDIHIATSKHRKMIEKQESSEPIDEENITCIICNFMCKYKSVYDRHVTTDKHMNNVISNALFEKQAERLHLAEKQAEKQAEPLVPYTCKCGKTYASRSALWYHKKRCVDNIDSSENVNRVLPISHTFITDHYDTDMSDTIQSIVNAKVEEQIAKMGDTNITKLIEAQAVRDEAAAEQTRLLIEAISLSGPRSITNNTTNNNNQFNLNVFLNEDCKDAFTLKEVIESIVCTVSDLDRMDTDGYAATITRKILESMQHMSITERPIHCTDAKRNAVCVKNETGWERNEKAMKLLVNSVYFVGRKLGCMIEDWKIAYPDHYHGTVSRRDQFHRMVTDAMSVADLEVEARIASKVCKGVILDRKAAMDR